MKKLLVIFLLLSEMTFGQSVTGSAVNGYQIPAYAVIQTYPSRDTLAWFWNAAETQTHINTTVASNVPGFAKGIMTIYTYSVTPLYHISAPVYSLCATLDTGLYIKVLGTDSAGWFKVR